MSQQKVNSVLVGIMVGVGILFLVGLLYRPALLILLFIVALGAFFGGSYFFVSSLVRKKNKGSGDSVIPDIHDLIRQCEVERIKQENEVADIHENIEEIETSMDSISEINPDNQMESKKILAGFYRELDLRKTKVDFYGTCKVKLETLLHNYQFSKDLEAKKNKLRSLQENHHEDLATMESIRSNLEYNKRFLETIETLSLRMLSSNSLDSAQQLKTELKQVTEELRRI